MVDENDVVERALSEATECLSRAPIRSGMTEFQVRRFVLGREPTAWGAYRQACLEIRARMDAIEAARASLSLLDEKQSRTAAEARRAFAEKSSLEDSIESSLAELELFAAVARELKESLPADQKWEDEGVQREYWTAKLAREAVLSVEAGILGVPLGVLDAATCLGPDGCSTFLDMLDSRSGGCLGLFGPASTMKRAEIERKPR